MKAARNRSRFVLALVASLLLPCAGSIYSFGQESQASLAGRVTDTKNAVVVGATVTVTSVETGVVQTTTTNQSGEWLVEALNAGHYWFEVSAPGFKNTKHEAIELQVGDQKTADVRLLIGAVTQTVTVGAETPLIDTTAAVSGTVITTKELEELPSLDQVPTLLAGLTPGSVVGSGSGGAIYLWSNIGASQIQNDGGGSTAGGGATGRAIQYQLDGAYDSNSNGEITYIPPQDAISEFRMVTNAYDTSVGRQSSTTLSMVTKTGTKDFHGTLYEYNQTNLGDARIWNGTTQTPHTNQFGATVGGPVWLPHLYNGRNKKTFFFFSFADIHNEAPVNSGYMNIPSALERTGDFSQTCQVTNGVVYYGDGNHGTGPCTGKTGVAPQPFHIYDPTSNIGMTARTLFPINSAGTGYQIPATRISPFATAIFKLMPLPDPTTAPPNFAVSSDTNNFKKNEVQRDRYQGYIIRLDQAWNNSNHSYANISFNNWNEASFNPFGGFAGDVLNSFDQARKEKILTLDHNIVLNPRTILDLKYSILNNFNTTVSGSANYNPSTLGLSSTYLGEMQLQGMPGFTGVVNGAEQGGLGTQQGGNYTVDTFQTFDVGTTQTFHNHTFKYGFEHLIQQAGQGALGTSAGSFSFGSATNTTADSWTCHDPVVDCKPSVGNGSNIAQFLLGMPISGSIPINATSFWSQHYQALYFQDDWRVSSKVTLNLGLRWDFETGVSERDNRDYTRYNPTYVQTAVTTPSQATYTSEVGSPSTTNIGVNLLRADRSASSFVTTGAIEYAGVHGTPDTLYNPKYRYVQPRIGIAYRFFPNTVIRGGIGRFLRGSFDLESQNGFSQTTNYTPTSNNFYQPYTNPATGHTSTLSNPYPDGLTLPTGNSLAEQSLIGSVTGFTDPNLGHVYVDEASASIQQQARKFLFEVGGTYERTHGLTLGTPTNAIPNQTNATPSQDYVNAFGPQFDPTGRPLDTLSGNTPVPNPYKGVAGLNNPTASIYTSSTVNASQLLRPNPVVDSDIDETTSAGKATYYALLAKAERRYSNGFSMLQSFTWGRTYSQDAYLGNTNLLLYNPRQIDGGDVRFHYTLAPIYELPFGKGKRFLKGSNRAMELLVGGWDVVGIYNFQSGTPITLPTNTTAFYRGDASPDKNITRGRTGTYFDTTAFRAYPNKSTPISLLQQYPSWTGVSALPGYSYVPTANDTAKNGVYNDFISNNGFTFFQHTPYPWPQTFGDIREPPTDTLTAGLHKNFIFSETFRFQLRADATNVLNHPQFGNIGTDPNSAYFGMLSGALVPTTVNNPRVIEIAGKLYF
jgi:Carboxypeptidase regulatory-like domain